jgi:undecaprenyl-diphosphatase
VPWWDTTIEVLISDYLAPVMGSLVLMGMWFMGTGETRLRNQFVTICGTMSVGFASGAVGIINGFYFRTRPFIDLDLDLLFYQPTDSSFPANTTAVGFAMAAAVFIRRRRLGLALFGLAFLWGFARVYSGIHYPSDVLAGGAIGIAAAGLGLGLTQLLSPLLRLVLRVPRAFYLA